MSLQLVAQHLAQKGRGPDSTLVHMSNREVAGLNALAKKHGGELSVNPDTGLPEAGFLDSILPAVAGAGLTYLSGGALSPLMSAGIVGGLTALDSKDLSKGLMAGLGAWGGGEMVGGLAGLGAAGADTAAMAAPEYQAAVGTGTGNFMQAPMASLSTLGGGSALKGSLPILAGLAPAAADMLGEEDEGDGAPAQHKGYIRKYALDPVTGQYKQVGAYEAGGDPNVDVSDKAGTAGAFGGVGQSEYQKAHGMADGGSTSDSSRIYDYLMGRGPNPMQFTHTTSPQVDYNINKTPAPITPTTPILEPVYDPYGNAQHGGQTQEQRDQREKDWNTPQDYLSIDRYNPETGSVVKDVQSNASLAALSPAERAMHMQDVRLQSPIRTFVSDAVTQVGIIPIGAKILESIMNPFGKPVNLNRAPVEDRTTYNMDVANDLQKQAEATQQLRQQAEQQNNERINELNKNADYTGMDRNNNAGKSSDGPNGPEGRGDPGGDRGGWGRGGGYARGGLPAPHSFYHQGKFGYKGPQVYADGGGIADLEGHYNLGGYSDGGRLLKGPGDGVSDDIPATIGHGQPARLADGEFVIPARIVSEIGNGSTDAGARELYKMMDRVQAGRRKTVGKDQVATNSKAVRHLPA
jgi:hypothetical protein